MLYIAEEGQETYSTVQRTTYCLGYPVTTQKRTANCCIKRTTGKHPQSAQIWTIYNQLGTVTVRPGYESNHDQFTQLLDKLSSSPILMSVGNEIIYHATSRVAKNLYRHKMLENLFDNFQKRV